MLLPCVHVCTYSSECSWGQLDRSIDHRSNAGHRSKRPASRESVACWLVIIGQATPKDDSLMMGVAACVQALRISKLRSCSKPNETTYQNRRRLDRLGSTFDEAQVWVGRGATGKPRMVTPVLEKAALRRVRGRPQGTRRNAPPPSGAFFGRALGPSRWAFRVDVVAGGPRGADLLGPRTHALAIDSSDPPGIVRGARLRASGC